MATTTQPAAPVSSVRRLQTQFKKLLQSILGKTKVRDESLEQLAHGLEELASNKAASVGNGNGDDESLLASVAPTSHDDSNTSLTNEEAARPSGVPPIEQPTLLRPSSAIVAPQMSLEFDVSTPFPRRQRLASSPHGPVSGSNSPLASPSLPADCEDLELEWERRRSNLLDLEWERTRIKLLELERERTKITLIELERERARINLLDQRIGAGAYALRPHLRATFEPLETSNHSQNRDLSRSGYRFRGANAQLRRFPADISHRPLNETWTHGFRPGLGSVV